MMAKSDKRSDLIFCTLAGIAVMAMVLGMVVMFFVDSFRQSLWKINKWLDRG